MAKKQSKTKEVALKTLDEGMRYLADNRVDATGAFRLKKALFSSYFVRKLVMQLRLHSHFPALLEEKMSIFLH